MQAKAPLLLAGPTAVGKSAIALALAEKLDGEIISVDSMQVYRGLNIGTAKPSTAEQRRVPHHLIDIVEPEEQFDAAQFLQRAAASCRQIWQRGKHPIFCGGTGLYFEALLRGLGSSPPGDPRLRSQLEARPVEELLEELKASDPVSYERIDRQNRRRLVRAVEVLRLTGKPFSALRADWEGQGSQGPIGPAACFIGFKRQSADLRQRIDARVERMFEEGLVGEVRALRERGLTPKHAALQAIGYKQVFEFLEGTGTLAETVARVQKCTRQYAKRQMTWFRHQARLQWHELAPGEPVAVSVERILQTAGVMEHCS